MLNHLLPVINSETTTIPHILRKHGLDPECVLEEANFPLLELDAPAVCADRLDYGIRDAHSFGFTTAEEARNISADLVPSKEGRFCFKSVKWARKLAETYMQADEYAWSNPNHSLLYQYAVSILFIKEGILDRM
jgi:HD superfamily phosphohydrolase